MRLGGHVLSLRRQQLHVRSVVSGVRGTGNGLLPVTQFLILSYYYSPSTYFTRINLIALIIVNILYEVWQRLQKYSHPLMAIVLS